ncbi:SDR family oxidoreductase [Halopseudomonas formosensis]|jgi:NAD(P)-dependent dehydrogenase (short-subunit alcohol dehydrogenase family)|uniref:SDR family oxidoreductase n=1 Tax=Halopseudomonas formosensis TaxID=1002526 RepID=A0A1I6BSI2_9GAMM|nr:SDR family oxidoreductase [Halopseudomonas formosensis]MDX9686153.1 SDR family oxidoreductase [Halopseudomonas formosensis]MDY3198592.1 SDR family oxidoreductase [Pseudomonadaceae bacterium]NLC02295.1 SDR family oxidoreductase [Halopseudomonas formosensis]SFQ83882.1 Short-chain dehydrogenase [Halopseudomonas formosensis]
MNKPVALITGCSSGIGQALAQVCLDEGYTVYATARNPDSLAPLTSRGALAVTLDVNNAEQVAACAERLRSEAGRLDLLVNNAGYGAMGPVLDADRATLLKQFDTNVFAPLEMVRAHADLLREARGLIVNIGSVSGVTTTPFSGVYCASKAALHALSDALRLELAPFGIQVLTVQPGAIASEFGNNASAAITMAEDSWFKPWEKAVQARAKASQNARSTSAREFAEELMDYIRKPLRPETALIGSGARSMVRLKRWLPTSILDTRLRKRFKLDRML